MTIRRPYCCGFLFYFDSVLLCRKAVPEWQAGFWNGVGGKIEPGESAAQAMTREGMEEAHAELRFLTQDWNKFAEETHEEYVVHFFRARAGDSYLPPARNDAGERLAWHSSLNLRGVIGNLRWLIPLAMDWRRFQDPVSAHVLDDVKRRPSW